MVVRKELFWGESIGDDKPLEALFETGYTYTDSEWGLPEDYHGGTRAILHVGRRDTGTGRCGKDPHAA